MKKTKRATLLDRMSAYFIDTLLLMFIYLGVWSGAQFLPKNNVLAYSILIKLGNLRNAKIKPRIK